MPDLLVVPLKKPAEVNIAPLENLIQSAYNSNSPATAVNYTEAVNEHSDTHRKPKKASSSQLSREDFDGGPVSVDQIEKGLFLGW